MFDDAIDTEFLQEDLLYCRGYAQSLAAVELPYGQARFDNYAVAATYYRRAAEHALYLSTVDNAAEWVTQAHILFGDAAEQYKKWGSPYAILLASLADNPAYLQELTDYFFAYLADYESQIRLRPAKIAQYVYTLIVDSDEPLLSGRVREWMEPIRHQQLGVLKLSVNQIINVMNAINRGRGELIQEAITPVLTAYSEALQLATQNRYHFRRLLMNFHPVNSEVIGLLQQIQNRSRYDARNLIETSPVNVNTRRFLLEIIQNMSQPGRRSNEGGTTFV